MGIAMGLDDMAINGAAAGPGGAARSITMGLDGVAFDEAAAGLAGAAMSIAIGLDGMAIVLVGVRGQTRGIITGLSN